MNLYILFIMFILLAGCVDTGRVKNSPSSIKSTEIKTADKNKIKELRGAIGERIIWTNYKSFAINNNCEFLCSEVSYNFEFQGIVKEVDIKTEEYIVEVSGVKILPTDKKANAGNIAFHIIHFKLASDWADQQQGKRKRVKADKANF